jgi:hypothetical protein
MKIRKLCKKKINIFIGFFTKNMDLSHLNPISIYRKVKVLRNFEKLTLIIYHWLMAQEIIKNLLVSFLLTFRKRRKTNSVQVFSNNQVPRDKVTDFCSIFCIRLIGRSFNGQVHPKKKTCIVRTKKVVKKVKELFRRKSDLLVRKMSIELDVSRTRSEVKSDLKLKPYKNPKVHCLNMAQIVARVQKC